MAGENAIQVEGAIVEVLPNQTCRVELSNGHRVLAYVAGRARFRFVRLGLGDRVRLEMSPYDLSKGRIIVEDQTDL
jgi:translation initiation factor IF-1